MRSREEIAAISNEIAWNVSRKIKLEEMAKTAKRLAKAYQPELLTNAAIVGLLNGGYYANVMSKRNLEAIVTTLKTRESFDAYRKRVQEKFAEEKGI
ncbi:MAG: hypothetical protein J6U28_08750 [Bacteroidales bacterium]|nr:hypothetical protein [Bacteroidales bacterium]